MSAKARHTVVAGFLPLLDSALLVTARERGFAREEDIDLVLVRETSWANIRDRMAIGHFDAAHMLGPMPIAANLGLTPWRRRMVAPMALGLGGNAVTVSGALGDAMAAEGATPDLDAAAAGRALRAVVAARARSGLAPLRFAVVHPHSGHNYELRYWLAGSRVHPDRDVEIVHVPPPFMADALGSGAIDGYCVGEPWNSHGVERAGGRIVTVKARIWRSSPEKVLGVAEETVAREPAMVEALLRALHKASLWCGQVANHEALAETLSASRYLDGPPERLMRGLSGALDIGGGAGAVVEDFFVPAAKAATFPWQSHALWFYSQMLRWDHVAASPQAPEIVRRTYRPDLFRRALAPLEAPLPGANAKVEGALASAMPVGATTGELVLGPDGFFDGRVFDPDLLEDYVAGQKAIDAAA